MQTFFPKAYIRKLLTLNRNIQLYYIFHLFSLLSYFQVSKLLRLQSSKTVTSKASGKKSKHVILVTSKMDYYDVSCNRLRHLEPNFNVKISLSMLRYIGNWPPSGSFRWLYNFYTVLSFTFIVFIYVFIQSAFVIVVWGDMEKMIGGAFLLMTNIGHCYKMITILVRQKKIQALLDVMASEIFSAENVKYERILTWYSWDGIFHHVAYQSIGCVAVFSWGFAPIADLVSANARRLPIESWYPYSTENTPIFEITCGHQIVAVILLCVHNVAMDTLATNLICVACCQLEILKRNIQAIDCQEFDVEKKEVGKKLKCCVEHNNTIIDFVNEIQDIFGTAIVYHCFVNCVIICLTAFHITRMSGYVPAEIIGTTMYLLAVIYQMFIFCWRGNELSLHSASVALAAYSGNWWKFNERYKSALRIIMIHSQRPLVIKAGGVLPVSLETFMSIIRTSYSFLTVLQGLAND